MKLATVLMSAGLTAAIAATAIAQDADTGMQTTTDGTGMAATTDMDAGAAVQFETLADMTVADLLGRNVYTPEGDKIGDVDYVIGQGGTAQAVVGIGGFLGLGEYTVALPLSDFGYDAAQQMVTLNASKEALKAEPEFDEAGAESLPGETRLADLMDGADTTGDAPAQTD